MPERGGKGIVGNGGHPPDRVSPRGLAFIAEWEGFVDHPYNDAAGFATIGYGHLLHLSPVTAADVAHWGKITHGRGLELLAGDVASVEGALNRLPARLRMQHRYDAIASLAFNVGVGVLDPSHSLGSALRAPGRAGVASAVLLYDHAGGRRLPGLTRRRRAEANLWTTGVYE